MAEEVIIDILWSPTAKTSYDNIINYLLKEWTTKEVERFVQRTDEIFLRIKQYPEMSTPSPKRKYARSIILQAY